MLEAMNTITEEDAMDYFIHAGYFQFVLYRIALHDSQLQLSD
jgi:hypothetical protein